MGHRSFQPQTTATTIGHPCEGQDSEGNFGAELHIPALVVRISEATFLHFDEGDSAAQICVRPIHVVVVMVEDVEELASKL